MGYRGVPAPGRKVVARTIEIIIKIFVFYRYLLVQNIFIIIIHSSFLPAERGLATHILLPGGRVLAV